LVVALTGRELGRMAALSSDEVRLLGSAGLGRVIDVYAPDDL